MKRNFKKGAAALGIATIITGGSYGVALGWTSLKTIAQGEVLSGLVEKMNTSIDSNKEVADALKAYQEKTDQSIVDLKITTGTTNELIKLQSDKQGINSTAVEARVIKQVASSTDAE